MTPASNRMYSSKMDHVKRLLRISRNHDYSEIPSHDSGWSESPHDYLDNLGGPIISPLLGSQGSSARQREWLLVDDEGHCSYVLVDKHELVLNLGIRYRDLRIIDPHVPTPYPSGLFLREKAMVVNLESLRCLICKDRVYVLSVPTPGKPLNCATTLAADNFFVKDLILRVRPSQPGSLASTKSSIDRQLPYELRALESALAAAVRTLEIETMILEKQTLPALSRLMVKVTRGELNTVRYSKTVVDKLLERIGHIKKELEDLLDDDEDMRACYLARKEEQKLAAEEAARQEQEQHQQVDEEDDEFEDGDEGRDMFRMQSLIDNHHVRESAFSQRAAVAFPEVQAAQPVRVETPAESSAVSPRMSQADSAPPTASIPTPQLPAPAVAEGMPIAMSAPATEMPSRERRAKRPKSHWRNLHELTTLVGVLRGMGPPGANITLGEILDPNDISGCESLLEAYFLQVDYLMSRLSALKGRIAGIEDQLNIEMDHRRNELQALDLAITAFMSSLAFISMIGGVYGMNMKNGFEESRAAFYTTVALTLFVAFLLLLGILMYARRKRLLFIPVY